MSRALRPRRLAWRGRVPALGAVVHERLGGRARVLSLWSPGCVVTAAAGAWVLRWRDARDVEVDRFGADPLCAVELEAGHLLATAPLDARELEALDALGACRGDVVRVRGGEAVVERPRAADEVDVAAWLDLGDVQVLEAKSLGVPPTLVLATPARGLAEVLLVAGSEKARSLGAALGDALAAMLSGDGDGDVPAPGLLAKALSAVSAVLGWFGAARAGGDGQGEGTGADVERAPPSALARALTALRAWLVESLYRARMDQLFGADPAAWLRDLVARLEGGDLEGALRRAPPLEGGGGGAGGFPLTLPEPRKDLVIHPQQGTGGASFGVRPTMMQRLRALYLKAAERLEADGRIDEAAFVLGELLRDVAAAVSLLERHGRLAQAAELAERAGLAPDLVVSLWLRARDHARGLRHARRTQCYEAALTRLEPADPEVARALRRAWATTLADAGDLSRAIEVAWRDEALRPMTAPWIERALAAETPAASRLLARAVWLDPARFDDAMAALARDLADTSAEGVRRRLAMADAIAQLPEAPALAPMARVLVRALAEDSAVGRVTGRRAQLEALASHARDRALVADLPRWPEVVQLPLAHRVLVSQLYTRSDVGTRPVHDAALLPDGRAALAMGESGVWLVARDGRVTARLDAPATRLVLSDHGDRCLAVCRRGSVWRVARVDLAARRAEPWGDVRVDAFADTYDGAEWLVARGREVLRLDALGDAVTALDRVVDVGREARGVPLLARAPQGVGLLVDTAHPRDTSVWGYDLPRWTLRARRNASTLDRAPLAVDARGALVCLDARGHAELCLFDPTMRACGLGHHATGMPALACALDARWVAVALRGEAGARVLLVDCTALQVRWRADLEGAAAASLRLSGEHLVVADDRGRVVALDLERGDVVRDLRV